MKAISRYWAVRNGIQLINVGLEVFDFATNGKLTKAIQNATPKPPPPPRLKVRSTRGEPR